MKKKKPSERMNNQLSMYVNDDEHLLIMRRMGQKNLMRVAVYLRKLVAADIKGFKP